MDDVRVGIFRIECKEKQEIPKWLADAWEQAKHNAKDGFPLLHIHHLGDHVQDDMMLMSVDKFHDMLQHGLEDFVKQYWNREVKEDGKES